jgi:Arc/MetJ-type ribon-helix-helix transcriptional regulator
MSIMIKKHINLPEWIDSDLKELVNQGYFPSEAEAIRTALALMLTSNRKLSPKSDTALFEEIANLIDRAVEEIQKCRLPSAIEYLHQSAQTLQFRFALSIHDDSEFVNSIRVINRVLADCLSSLAQILKEDFHDQQLKNALEEFETVENLRFLSEAYRGLAKLKYEGVNTEVAAKKFEPNNLRESK